MAIKTLVPTTQSHTWDPKPTLVAEMETQIAQGVLTGLSMATAMTWTDTVREILDQRLDLQSRGVKGHVTMAAILTLFTSAVYLLLSRGMKLRVTTQVPPGY
jgi:hypothetical protein